MRASRAPPARAPRAPPIICSSTVEQGSKRTPAAHCDSGTRRRRNATCLYSARSRVISCLAVRATRRLHGPHRDSIGL